MRVRRMYCRAPGGVLVALSVVCLAAAVPVRAEAPSAAEAPALRASALPASTGAAPAGLLSPLFSVFDPDRLTFRNTLSFGVSSGGSYSGTSGLFTSSIGYRLADPLNLRVDLGAHLNPAFGGGRESGLFLQGFTLDWRPSGNSLFRIQYQDLRSPLQYAPYGGWYAPVRRPAPDPGESFVPSPQ